MNPKPERRTEPWSRTIQQQREPILAATANAVISETFRTWNRPEAPELAKLLMTVAPNFTAVVESYQKAQDVIKQQKK